MNLDRNIGMDYFSVFRHVEVSHNVDPRRDEFLCGRSATPPTREGIEKAKKLSIEIQQNWEFPNNLKNPSVIIASPAERARLTADLIYPGRKKVITEDVDERTYGEDNERRLASDVARERGISPEALDTFRRTFIPENDPEWTMVQKLLPGAQSLNDVYKVAEHFMKLARAYGWDNPVIFSHTAKIKMLIGVCCGLTKDEILKLQIKNCTPYVLKKRKGNRLYELAYPPTWDSLIKN